MFACRNAKISMILETIALIAHDTAYKLLLLHIHYTLGLQSFLFHTQLFDHMWSHLEHNNES